MEEHSKGATCRFLTQNKQTGRRPMRTTSSGVVSRKIRLAYFAGAVAALPSMAGTASADEVFKATSAVTGLGSQKIVSFDIGFVDPAINRYLLADRTNKAIDIVDTTHNTVTH